ncbi:MAG TPA: NUDIX domain-containing protein [Xanthobacteraceae bacterium]|nr:NUDIX domain-containing protein [Xanthobacteraceae bacterium]
MHAWWLVSRGMTLGVRAVVLDARGGVLLLRHTYAPGWQFPGGGVEPGETMADALARELEEEAAVRVLGTPAFHGLFFNPFVTRRDHVAVYVVQRYAAGVPQVPNREIAEVRFWPLDALPPDTTPGTRRRLHEIAQGLPPAPRW